MMENNSSPPRSPRNGFTLIELLVCLVLIGLMSSFVITGLKGNVNIHKTQALAVAQFLRVVRAKSLSSVHSYVVTPTSSQGLTATAVNSCKQRLPVVTESSPIFTLEKPLSITPLSWDICFQARGLVRGQTDGSVNFKIIDEAPNDLFQNPVYELRVGLGGEVSLITGVLG